MTIKSAPEAQDTEAQKIKDLARLSQESAAQLSGASSPPLASPPLTSLLAYPPLADRLWSRAFLPLMITQFLGAFNDNLFRSALIILVTYQLADQIGIAAGILNNLAIALFILPFFIFSALAGSLADKYQKQRQIRWIKIWEIGLVLLGALAFQRADFWMLVAVLAGLGLQSTFFGPLKYSALPACIQPNKLLTANGLIEAATFLAILLGTIMGSLFILGKNGALHISIATITVAALGWIASCFIPRIERAAPDLKISLNIFKISAKLLKTAWATPFMRPSMITISWVWMLGAVLLAQIPTITKEQLGGDESAVTLLLSCFSVGIGLGSIGVSAWLKGFISARLAGPGLVFFALLSVMLYMILPSTAPLRGASELINYLVFFNQPLYFSILSVFFLLSLTCGVIIVPLYTILQAKAPPSTCSRMVAANNILNAAFMAGGTGLAALMISFDLPSKMILVSLGFLGLTLVPSLYRLERQLHA